MLKLINNLLLIIGLFSGFVQASELNKDLDPNNLLTQAVRQNQIDAARHALTAGANVDAIGAEGLTPLMIASMNGNVALVNLLLGAGAYLNYATNGWTALIFASKNGHAAVVRMLLAAGANLNHTAIGCTALIFACENGHTQVVKMLIEAGANVNQATAVSGLTPLISASKNGHAQVVKMLLEAGANLNQAIIDDKAPLISASKNGHAQVMKMLLEAGAHVNQAIIDGRTEDQLTEYDLKLDGWTALIFASEYGHAEVVRILLEAGADVNHINIHGLTALDMALDNGYTAIVEILEGHVRWHGLRSAWCGAVFSASNEHDAASVDSGASPKQSRIK